MVDFYISKNLMKNDDIVLAKLKEGIAKSSGKNAVKNLNTKPSDNFTKTSNISDDDGKISLKEKIINFGKGIIKPIKTIFSSPKNIAITAVSAAAAAGLIFITSGAAAPIMVTAGLLGGAFQIGKGIYKQAKAKTDDEAKNAWQDMGSGTFTVGVSALGAKSALKATGASNTKDLSLFKSIIECVKKSSPSNIINAFKTASGKFTSFFTHTKSSGNTKINNGSSTKTEKSTTSGKSSSGETVPPKKGSAGASSETKVPPKTEGTSASSSSEIVPPKKSSAGVSSETKVPPKTEGTVKSPQINEIIDAYIESQNKSTPKYIPETVKKSILAKYSEGSTTTLNNSPAEVKLLPAHTETSAQLHIQQNPSKGIAPLEHDVIYLPEHMEPIYYKPIGQEKPYGYEIIKSYVEENILRPRTQQKTLALPAASAEKVNNIPNVTQKLSTLDKIKNFFKLFGLGLKDKK